MKTKIVLDSSALIALFNKEPGYQIVENSLPHGIISAVNFSETLDVLQRMNIMDREVETLVNNVISEIHVFDYEQAVIAASLRKQTSSLGLSFGDRACLALAKLQKIPVLTADKVWSKLKADIEIQLIR